MAEKIYIIGHKSPDLDSVAAAIAYAALKNKLENTDIYTPAVAGELNQETEYALNKFGFDKPVKLDSLAGQSVILVDHNESSQALDGIAEAKILEVLDHHKINFNYSEPILLRSYPWGATCSIVANFFIKKNIELSKELAGLLLSGVLVDTVITKSPTCCDCDQLMIERLSEISGITDWQAFGMEIFKVRSNVSSLSADQILRGDFKDFNFACGKCGIGQVETVDLGEFAGKEAELLAEVKKTKEEGGYSMVMLFITDIIKEGSKFFAVMDDETVFEKAFGQKLENCSAFVPGIISRKKQVAPKIEEVLK